MFRCPNPECGQAVTLPIGEYMLYNSRDMKSPIITKPLQNDDFISCIAKSQTLFTDESFDKLNPHLAISYRTAFYSVWNSNYTIACPRCKEPSKFSDWRGAYQDPLGYEFEMNELCFCGEEMMLDRTPMGRYALFCDKCEEFKPDALTYSGSGDTTMS